MEDDPVSKSPKIQGNHEGHEEHEGNSRKAKLYMLSFVFSFVLFVSFVVQSPFLL